MYNMIANQVVLCPLPKENAGDSDSDSDSDSDIPSPVQVFIKPRPYVHVEAGQDFFQRKPRVSMENWG